MRCKAPNFFETAMSSSYMPSCSKIWDKVVKAIAEPSGLSSFVFSKIYPLFFFYFRRAIGGRERAGRRMKIDCEHFVSLLLTRTQWRLNSAAIEKEEAR